MGRVRFPIRYGVKSNQNKFQLSSLWDMPRTGYQKNTKEILKNTKEKSEYHKIEFFCSLTNC